MRETSFIKQKKDKWKSVEAALNKESKDPDQLKEAFIQITDDLSYARTFYPNRSVRVYLNNLAQQIFYSIYKSKRTGQNRFIKFWTDELPHLVFQSKKAFQLSLGIFVLAFLIGAFSSAMDIEFPRVILGDYYVDMTIENIESGDPMAVYKQKGEFDMSLGITLNNLLVAFRTFVLGVFFAIGSIAIMLYNGIMVGAFQYFFYEKGVFWESFLTIWTHGTLEISAIIIAGAAGMTMGSGLVFPGTYTRLQAFLMSARRGMKIMIGITPIIILAGIIEGYLTRYTETPDVIRLFFILGCLAFVLFYFVWYPFFYKSKVGFNIDKGEEKLPPDANDKINFSAIKSTGEIYTDIFKVFRQYALSISLMALVLAFLYCSGIFILTDKSPSELYTFSMLDLISNYLEGTDNSNILEAVVSSIIGIVGQLFKYNNFSIAYFLNSLFVAISLFASYYYVIKLYAQTQTNHQLSLNRGFYLKGFFGIAFLSFLVNAILISDNILIIFAAFCFLPFILLWAFIVFFEEKSPFVGLSRMYSLLTAGFIKVYGTYFITLFINFLLFLILYSPFMYFYYQFIVWNLPVDEDSIQDVSVVLLTFSNYWGIHMILPLLFIGIGLLYFTLLEIKEAPYLFSRIKRIGVQKRIRGMERE